MKKLFTEIAFFLMTVVYFTAGHHNPGILQIITDVVVIIALAIKIIAYLPVRKES